MLNKTPLCISISLALGLMSHSTMATLYNGTFGDDITVVSTADGPVGHAFGVYIQQDQHTVVGDRLSITVSGVDADGLRSNPSGMSNWQQAKGSITIGNDLEITTKGLSGDGINANGATIITIGNNATITTEYTGSISGKEGAHGVRANFNATIDIGDGLTVKTLGERSHAFYSAQGLGIPAATEGAKIKAGDNTTAIVEGKGSHVAYLASKNGKVEIGDGASLTTQGEGGNIAYVTAANALFTLGTDAVLSTLSDTAHGIYTTGADSVIGIGDRLELSTNGIKAHAIYTKSKNGVITLGEETTLLTTGDDSYGINVEGYRNNAGTYTYGSDIEITLGKNSYIETNGANAHAIYMYGHNGEVILNQDSTVKTTGDGSHALYSHGSQATPTSSIYGENGKISAGNNITVSTIGDNSHAVYVDWAGNNIDFNGDATISATGTGSYAVYADAGSISSITSGKFTVTGDMFAENEGKINLDMTDGSNFQGNTSVSGANSELNLNIDGATSVWNMDANSDLTSLHLTNGAHVVLSDQTNPITNSPDNSITLTMENLSGSGVFHMRTDIVGTGTGVSNIGDFIDVTGTSSGSHQVIISDHYNGSAVNDGSELLHIIQTADGGADFTLSTATVDVGAYQYELVRGDQVTNSLTPLNTEDWWLRSNGRITRSADNSGNLLNISYLLSNVENQTLLQRLGELRRNRISEGDIWVRGYAGKLTSFQDTSLSGFDMEYNGLQIGADKYLGNDFYVGMVMGMGKGDVDYEVGSGSVKSNHLGLYGTYKSQNGWYVDAIAKYVHMKNTFDTETGGGNLVEGRGNTNGYSAGIEVGKRFFLQQADKGWYIEPQAQYTYSHQNSADVKSSNGLVTTLDKFDSQIGRVSAIIGYSVADGDNPVDVYLKTGYVKEFDGKTGYSFNGGDREKYKFNGDWWDNGIGVSAQLKKRHNIYLEADYAMGDKFDKKQVNLGYRYAF